MQSKDAAAVVAEPHRSTELTTKSFDYTAQTTLRSALSFDCTAQTTLRSALDACAPQK